MTLDTVAFWSLVFWWSVIAGCLSVMAIALKREGVRAYRQWRVRAFVKNETQKTESSPWLHRTL